VSIPPLPRRFNTTTPAFDLAAAKKIIAEKTARFAKAHTTRDTAYLNNIFTEDARAYGPNAEAVRGRKAISALNQEWVNYDIKEARIESTNFYGCNEYLIDEGQYSFRYGKENTIDKGNYIYVWKNVNGDWKLHADMWGSSLPVAAPK